MVKLSIDLDDELLAQIQAQLKYLIGTNGAKVLPETKKAFDTSAAFIRQQWQGWAMGGSIAGAQNIKPNPRLCNSIRMERLHDFNIKVGTDSEIMQRIEEGTSAREINMKDTNSPWLTSRKTRITKHGKYKGLPYLLIPFRWGTPKKDGSARAHFTLANTIDLKSYAIIKSRKFSRRTSGQHTEPNIYGENVLRGEYDWGGRLSASETDNPNAVGMVRMIDEAGKNKLRPKSTYFTFRTLSAHSSADWKIKKAAIPPNRVMEALKTTLQPIIAEKIKEAFRADMS